MLLTCVASLVLIGNQPSQNVTPGQLLAIPITEGEAAQVCPLKGTEVTADIAGLAARVTVVQTFTNPYDHPIEAVYTFPLSSGAAVDSMRIKIGDRVVEGEIKRSEEARMIYEQARAAGQTAAILDQERPNIFTQSVANIMPGNDVQVEISYVELIDYEDGQFEFVFPMVVGPRNTMNAEDPEKISPPITTDAMRVGNDIRLTVMIDAGAPLDRVTSQLHAIDVRRSGAGKFQVSLARNDEIPNRDFILNWSPVGKGLQESFLTHATNGKGTFCLTLFPPTKIEEQFIAPRELIFVIDQSGSQSGYPIEKSKELTLAMLDDLRPDDLFNIVTFTTEAQMLWPESVPNVVERVREAKDFIAGISAGGGTDFAPPLKATISNGPVSGRIKMIVFNTDGFVGDDFQLLDLVQKFSHNARLFTFGIGNSVNRFLIDNMSAVGRGASEIVTLATGVDEAIERFQKRIQSPVLTDVRIKVSGGGVHDLTPEVVPDMFSETPIVVFGRYEKSGPATITVSGRLGGVPWQRDIDVVFPENGDSGEGVYKVWARKRLDDMLRRDWFAAVRSQRNGDEFKDNDKVFADFAIQHGIMSQWTSFIAVEKRVVNIGGRQRTVSVPVAQADGVAVSGDMLAEFGGWQNFSGVVGGVTTLKKTAGIPVLQNNAPLLFGYPDGLYRPSRNSADWFYQRGSVFAGSRPGTFARSDDPVFLNYSTGGKLIEDMSAEEVEEARKKQYEMNLYMTKTHPSLREKKEGKLEVQVLVNKWPEDWKKQMEEAGVIVAGSDDNLKVVFGTLDAEKLLALAKLEFVTEIRPLED